MAEEMWFKRKKYGWGWVPSTWQGWAITAVFVFTVLSYRSSELFIPIFIVETIVFLYIVSKKAPKPEWHWGKW